MARHRKYVVKLLDEEVQRLKKIIRNVKTSQTIRHCEEIRWTKMAQDFSSMTRRRSAGILGVFQALTTKS